MRISSSQQFQQGIDAILRQQAKLTKTQEQLATGNRILTPSDDPAASTQLIKLSALIASNSQYDRNITFAQNQVGLAESKLKSAGDIIQRVRELVVQANTAIHSNSSRGAIATEIQNNLDALLDVANSKDASGEYIFSGFNASTKPFVKEGDGYQYKGDQGERFLQVSEDIQVQVRDSGATIFQKIREGDGRLKLSPAASNQGNLIVTLESNVDSVVDTYAVSFLSSESGQQYEVRNSAGEVVQSGSYNESAQISFNEINLTITGTPVAGDKIDVRPAEYSDIFTTLQKLVEQLAAPIDKGSQQATLTTNLSQSMNEMDQVLGNFLSARASLGNRLQQLDVRATENVDAKIRYDRSISELKDLDYAQAVSRLNMQMTGLQAAQQSYVKVQGLSLFNYLK
ncbi:flagellar hook-associated protein FlgL [Pseudomonadales bacterium]|nr:flagellar hook-associated protein FlgL [Pseudomonadales bacterium]